MFALVGAIFTIVLVLAIVAAIVALWRLFNTDFVGAFAAGLVALILFILL